MCGIAGKLNLDSENPVDNRVLNRMLNVISHRGPDGHGTYVSGPIGLGHRRLSIIDLSTNGDQPMCNEDGTIWIVFNGEIYNYPELRADLLKRGHVFRSQTDTEVIVHLYEEDGPECVKKLRGMFAFAIWDGWRRRLFVARDRVGIKPLYYAQAPNSLWFGSELKSILVEPEVPREINAAGIRRFLSFYYPAGEETLFKSIKKLPAGHYLIAESGRVSVSRYWDLEFTRERWSRSFEEATEELRDLLGSTVKDHMIADVPVGVLLSGGTDSSGVLSLAVQGTAKRMKSFTVGFSGEQIVDERPYARLAAEKFGTDHHEISITAENFWNFLPQYVWHMEEPVCEPPAVALFYISKLAAQHVKVVLSGEGGDEAFAGYPNYPNMLRLQQIRNSVGPLAGPVGAMSSLAGRMIGDERLERYGAAMRGTFEQHYFSRTSGPTFYFNRDSEQIFCADFLQSAGAVNTTDFVTQLTNSVRDQPLLNQMLYVDTKTWLPDDLLIKADKMTMANSLELRVPLLDHKVLEFAASLPPAYKVGAGRTKRILKAVFEKAVPNEILTRKKAGFPVPYNRWMRNGLSEPLKEVLLSSQAMGRGYFKRKELEGLLQAHKCKSKRGKEVFSLLVLELWHRRFVDRGAFQPESGNCFVSSRDSR